MRAIELHKSKVFSGYHSEPPEEQGIIVLDGVAYDSGTGKILLSENGDSEA